MDRFGKPWVSLHNGVFVTERRIISPTCHFLNTWAPSASAVTSPFSTRCDVNSFRSRSWSPSTKLLVGSDFKRYCHGQVFRKGFPAFIHRRVQASCRVRRHSHLQCNMWRQASQDVHQYHENKCVLARRRKAVRGK